MRRTVHVLLVLLTVSPACGRTGMGKATHFDGSTNDGRVDGPGSKIEDAAVAADLALDVDSLDGEPACGYVQWGPLDWPVVELVVDRSASLQAQVEGGQTGWEVTRDALKRVISRLTPESPAVGLTLYPNRGDCTLAPVTVPAVPMTEDAKAALMAALDGVAPSGARSPGSALALATADATKTFPNGLTLSPAKTIILLASGAPEPTPSCAPQADPVADLLAQVQAVHEQSALIWVLALPGAGTARSLLTEISDLGCGLSGLVDASLPHQCFADCDRGVESGARIEDAVNCILAVGWFEGDACVINPAGDPMYPGCSRYLGSYFDGVDLEGATVEMTSGTSPTRILPHVDCSAEDADGWDFAPNRNGIIYCGQACDEAKASWYQQITFVCKGG